MNRRLILWGVPVALWLIFTTWYTDFGGPLSDEEVAEAMAYFDGRDIEPEFRDMMHGFLVNDSGRQFIIVNNIDMNETPPPMEGFGPDATSDDYMNHYMEHMYGELFSRASHPVFMGTGLGFMADLVGVEGGNGWDSAALFRYRSKRTFLEIVTHPDMGARHDFKIAALTKTIAYPVETVLYLSDPRFLLFLIFGLVTALIDILIYGRRK